MKTLITLSISACIVSGVAAAADSFTIAPDSGLTIDRGSYSGWVGSLDDSYLNPSMTLADEVLLSQITLTTPDSGTSPASSAKLSIFEYSSVNEAGTFVAISSNAATFALSSTLTFSFDSVALDPTKSYRFSFVSQDANETTYSPWQNVGVSLRIEMASVPDMGNDKGATSNGNAGSWASHVWMPNVTYTVSNVTGDSIPEPTTATLSLLALAGLAARRRRK